MDYENLEKAVKMIKDIADYVNGNMKTLENMNRVVEIDVALGGECKVSLKTKRKIQIFSFLS